jgi:uncharacterized cupin superfamily protein
MSKDIRPPALDPMSLEPQKGSGYPAPFRQPAELREKRALGDAVGLAHYGVNLVHLEPGGRSAQRHWHSHEDEFIYVLEGEFTLMSDAGEEVLGPGMAAGFPAGAEDGHHLINRGDVVAVFLEVGDRRAEDVCHYPDIDLVLEPGPGGHVFKHKNGEPYA